MFFCDQRIDELSAYLRALALQLVAVPTFDLQRRNKWTGIFTNLFSLFSFSFLFLLRRQCFQQKMFVAPKNLGVDHFQTTVAILKHHGSNFGVCRGYSLASSEQVPPLPLSRYFFFVTVWDVGFVLIGMTCLKLSNPESPLLTYKSPKSKIFI